MSFGSKAARSTAQEGSQAGQMQQLRPLACSKGVLALAVDLESLAELVSVGTLITFYCTAAAVLWRRHCDGTRDGRRRTAQRLGATAASSFGALQHLAWLCMCTVASQALGSAMQGTHICLSSLPCAMKGFIGIKRPHASPQNIFSVHG